MNGTVAQLESIVDALAGVSMQLVFGLMAVELVLLWCRKKWRAKKESWVSVASLGLGILPYELFFAVVQLQWMFWLYDNARLFTFGGQWYVWGLAFLAYELVWWLVHFAAHKVRFLWCIHGAHHTPTEMNMSVAVRGSLFDFVQYMHLVVWLPILGFHPFMVFSLEIIGRLYALITHLHRDFVPRTPVFDRFLVTPALHSVHHAKNPMYLDTNFANILALWDRLFGTHQPEVRGVEPVFGVTDESVDASSVLSTQFGLWRTLFADMRSTPRWVDKIRYLFMPPGWRPRPELSPPMTPMAGEVA